MKIDDVEVIAEDEAAISLGKLVAHLVAQRLQTCGQFLFGLPDKFAQLLSEDKKVVETCLTSLKAARDAYREVKGSALPFWKAVTKASPMNWVLVQEVMGALETVGFKSVPSQVEVYLKACCSHFQNTKVCEDMFQRVRAQESNRADGYVPPLQVWATPVAKGVLSQVHHYDEITTDGMAPTTKKSAHLPKKLWEARPSKQSVDCKPVVGTGKGDWPTFSPSSATVLWEALELASILHGRKRLHDGPRTWRTGLLTPGLLVQVKEQPGRTFFVAWRGQMCALLWPAKRTSVGKAIAWTYDNIKWPGQLLVYAVVEESHVKVIPMDYCTPLRKFISSGGVLDGTPAYVIQAGDPVELMKHLAERAFQDVSAQVVSRICKDVFDVDTAKLSQAEKVHIAIKHSLGVSEEVAGAYMERRFDEDYDDPAAGDVLRSEAVHDALSKDDEKVVKEYCDSADAIEEKKSDFLRVITKHRKVKAPDKKRARKLCRDPVKFDGDKSVSAVWVRSHVPSLCKVYRDKHQKRWAGFYPHAKGGGYRQCSKSWGPSGDEKSAAVNVLMRLWARHTSLGNPACPIDLGAL